VRSCIRGWPNADACVCRTWPSVLQNGTPIFNCQASFHRPEPSRINHQDPMPDVPPPHSVCSFDEQLQGLLENPKIQGR